jgi:C4-dicarboxylate-binding protein DctP
VQALAEEATAARAGYGVIMQFRALAFVAVLASQVACGPVFAEEVALRITLQQPISSTIGQNLLEFKREVEEKTGGSIKIDIYDKAQFYLDFQVPEAVGSGAIEAGVAPVAQYAQDIPAAGLFQQPFLFDSNAIVRATTGRKSEIRFAVDAEIQDKTGARVLWWQPYGTNVILGKGAYANPAAIANRNVRVFDDVSAQFVTLCGGKPHIISDAKQAEAFDEKIVDLSIASIASINNDELWRRVDTVTNIRHSANLFVVVLNQNTYASLSPEQQKVLIAAARRAEDNIWNKFAETEAADYSFLRSKGVKIAELSPDDTIDWRVCSSSILESYIERSGFLGTKLFEAYGRQKKDPCCNGQPAAAAGTK